MSDVASEQVQSESEPENLPASLGESSGPICPDHPEHGEMASRVPGHICLLCCASVGGAKVWH